MFKWIINTRLHTLISQFISKSAYQRRGLKCPQLEAHDGHHEDRQ